VSIVNCPRCGSGRTAAKGLRWPLPGSTAPDQYLKAQVTDCRACRHRWMTERQVRRVILLMEKVRAYLGRRGSPG